MNRHRREHAGLTHVRRQAGDWLVATRAMPRLSVEPADELLLQTAALPGNARMARTAEGVVMLADVYFEDSDDGATVAEGRLTRWLDG